MTIYGWITMIISVGGVTGLMVWCFYKTLTIPNETEKLHGYDISNMPRDPEKKRKRLEHK